MLRIQPDDINIIFDLPPETMDIEVVAIDSEWFNQDRNRLHRPHGDFACVGCTNNGRDVYMIFDQNQIQDFYARIDESVHAYHHAQYDIRQLRRFADLPDRKKIWDTMLVEQIRFSGYYDSFRLSDLARRYLNIYMSKDVREEFIDSECTTMTDEQIFYCAVDIVCTWLVAQKQREEIDEDDLNIWKHVERPFLWTLLDTKGAYFDADKWTKRYTEDARLAAELDEKLPFNPRSPKQVKEFFLTNYKIKLDGTAEGVLAEVAEEHPDIPELSMILDARGLSKASKTYGAKWVENMEEDHRIYPNWKQMVETGRMSCPGTFPIQTMPHEKCYRECIVAAPNHTLVICDYSSQEPRILAYLTQDPTLIDIFKRKKDIYIEVGFEVFEEKITKEDDRRKHMKTIVLGIPYGMGSLTLAARMGQAVEYAEKLLAKFFKKFPFVKKWVDAASVWKPYAETILGRKFWLNPYLNGWDRNAKNFPMQGSAVDCTKIAASKLRKAMGYNPGIVYMHDELVCEFPNQDLEKGQVLMEKIMVDTQEWMHEGIPGGVEKFVGANWSVKK